MQLDYRPSDPIKTKKRTRWGLVVLLIVLTPVFFIGLLFLLVALGLIGPD
jgi:hypothetical protein